MTNTSTPPGTKYRFLERKKLLWSSVFWAIIFLEIIPPVLKAQIVLKPSIGLSAIPNDNDPVCPIPLAIDSGNIFVEPGLHKGDTIPDFKLYTLTNDSMHIGDLLSDGKPVLLVDGSYTCPKYRNHLNELNDLQTVYGSEVHIFIVYTVEAHPEDPDISPYKGDVWELNSNINKGIIYHQPTTYLERKNVVTAMFNDPDIEIDVPVLIDGPCNAWWENFALSPNSSYLIQPNGIVFKKQGWFENGLYEVSNAIDSLLAGLPTGMPNEKNNYTVVNDPASPVIQFHFSEPQPHACIELIDAMGRKATSSITFTGSNCILQKQAFAAGIYLYAIHTLYGVLNGKILIQ